MSDDGSVQVSPVDLWRCGSDLVLKSLDHLGSIGQPIGGVVENTMGAFVTSPAATLPLREGVTVMELVKRNLTELQAFLGDVKAGLTAIQSAATAMAVAYATTDGDSAAMLSA